MNAIAKVFPSVIVNGCYYHYNKAVWRKGRLKLQNPIIQQKFANRLLPPSEVRNGWSYNISRKQPEDEAMKKFRAYMEKQWIKDDWIQTWNVYRNQHRTTNYLEGWHNKLYREVEKKMPNTIHFLNIVQKNQLKNIKERQKKNIGT